MTSSLAGVIIDTIPSQVPSFHMAIGRAITTWQYVEIALCNVFCKASTSRDEKVAAAIFYAVRDFSDKLNITHSAARISFAETPLFEEFNALRLRLRPASELRNALAHFHVAVEIRVGQTSTLQIRFLSEDGNFLDAPASAPQGGGRMVLRPNSSDPNEQFKDTRHCQATKKPMYIKDIVKLTPLFHALSEDLKAFSAKIQQPLAP
jgi:hypothetical protein